MTTTSSPKTSLDARAVPAPCGCRTQLQANWSRTNDASCVCGPTTAPSASTASPSKSTPPSSTLRNDPALPHPRRHRRPAGPPPVEQLLAWTGRGGARNDCRCADASTRAAGREIEGMRVPPCWARLRARRDKEEVTPERCRSGRHRRGYCLIASPGWWRLWVTAGRGGRSDR